MPRFTKAHAERLGWLFVHEQPETVTDIGNGLSKTIPANYRAEKPLGGGGLINEQADSEEKLLERIKLYEDSLVPADLSEEPSTEDDLNPNHATPGAEQFVVTPEERVEQAAQAEADALEAQEAAAAASHEDPQPEAQEAEAVADETVQTESDEAPSEADEA